MSFLLLLIFLLALAIGVVVGLVWIERRDERHDPYRGRDYY